MKCESCGGNYSHSEIKCPYCGKENNIGLKWREQEQTAKTRLERLEQRINQFIPLHILDKVLNGIIIFCGVAIALTIFLSESEMFQDFKNKIKRANADVSVLEEMYQQEDYKGIRDYVYDYELEGEAEFYKYVQLTAMYESREEFREKWLEFVGAPQEEFEEWSKYGLCYETLSSCITILQKDWYGYSEIPEESVEFYEEMCEEVEVFLVGEMELNDEELLIMREIRTYQDEWDAFYRSIYKKKGWEYSEYE